MGCMNVVDVPGYAINLHGLIKSYVSELKHVCSVESLELFVEKWKAIWLIPVSRYSEDIEELRKSIGEKRYDMGTAMLCISDCIDGGPGCIHMNKTMCAGVQIVLPILLLDVTLICKEFGVPDYTALHQCFCVDEDHKGCF